MEDNENVEPQKDCKHEHYHKEHIMDFAFNVCRDCGYQWPD